MKRDDLEDAGPRSQASQIYDDSHFGSVVDHHARERRRSLTKSSPSDDVPPEMSVLWSEEG